MREDSHRLAKVSSSLTGLWIIYIVIIGLKCDMAFLPLLETGNINASSV